MHCQMSCRLGVFFLLVCLNGYTQTQTCPVNINFLSGDLTHWQAYTGNNRDGNGTGAIKAIYDSGIYASSGTIGARFIDEYNLPGIRGIEVNTFSTFDPFGGFPSIPKINGYQYTYSIKLGSTSITRGNGVNNLSGGGYIRGISYNISVPAGPSTEPYTMTYAYAMVLENGTHVSNQQPVISATLTTSAGVITCASPSYYLPTFDNVTRGGRGATLDSAKAKKNGFRVSAVVSPNTNNDPISGQERFLQDVWTKNWTEVTFDLSPYRGQKVTLSFESDNCIPGGHFAYAYIAIRNSCAGLKISGDSLSCNNSLVTFSVPSLGGATYNWEVPKNWTILSGDNSNTIKVRSATSGGSVIVREINSCADLRDTIQVQTLPSPVGGTLDGSATVCVGENKTILQLLNYSGTIQNWLSSTDNLNWSVISDKTAQYTADNLGSTTFFRVVVGKGTVCPADTSLFATIAVDQKTIRGQINPSEATLCVGQTAGETLSLLGNTGSVLNWQTSTDRISWRDVLPVISGPDNSVKDIQVTTYYRTINRNGVCPADTSSPATILFNPNAFPQAVISPADTTICFGTSASLDVRINIGTSYLWIPVSTTSGNIPATPFRFVNTVSPQSTTNYILRVLNNGCPNPLLDSFHVIVLSPILVDAGRDTSVVVGEPLKFHASSNDEGVDTFSWVPATELSNPGIPDPVATYNVNDNVIKYTVKATTVFGCSGEGFITVKVFKTKPDIFVPNAFTPDGVSNVVFRPIPVGISSIQYFRIYNRLGQLVYNSSTMGSGWDGRVNGKPQGAGGYVWMVKGTDYSGNSITKNGTMVLVR